MPLDKAPKLILFLFNPEAFSILSSITICPRLLNTVI
jgi:hypothetical protein